MEIDADAFNYSQCSREMLFLCLSTEISLSHVFRISAFVMYSCFERCTPVGQLMRCSISCANVHLHS